MTDTRETWRVVRTGSLDGLRREREALAAPEPGQVRVGARAIGLNLADVFACLGMYSATPEVPFVPGLELAGVVESVGDPAPGGAAGPWCAGDRVIALTRFGGYATAVNADAHYLRRLPEGWSFAEGAAFAVQAVTAWYALHELGRLRPGEVVLVHSAAGGVGLNALALVRAAGARAVGTVGNEAKRDFLVERGLLAPSRIVVRDRRRFGEQLEAALAGLGADGFDVVVDGIAGRYFMPAYRRLRPEGRMVILGASDMMPAGRRVNRLLLAPRYLRRPRLDPMRMISSNRGVAGFNLIWLWDRLERLGSLYDSVASVLTAPPLVGRTFPFAEAPAALQWMKGGGSVGKVVLEVGAQG